MRVLLVIAAAAVAAFVWPRSEARHVCRSPTAGARAGLLAGQPASDESAIAVNLGGGTPGVIGGRCVLRLRLLDEVTGKPFTSDVELWRLDLPEDESWTAGDHRQATANVGPDGRTFADLPAGRYRAAVPGQSFLAKDDPPAFLVRGAVTDVELPVRAPRSHQVYLRVFSECGREIRTGKLRYHGWGWLSDDPTDPEWAHPRLPKRASASPSRPPGINVSGSGGHSRPDALWTEAGFDLGRCHEDSRGQWGTDGRSLLVPGHTAVTLEIDGRLSAARTYVAVSVSLDEIKDYVFLPDGRRAADAGALFEARCLALEIKPPASPDAWRSLPVNVRVGLGGYEVLTFEYQVDRPPPPQVMRPRVHG